MRARRATPRRRDAPRWTREEWEPATAALLRRDEHRCGRCWRPVTSSGERHHRQRRAAGGDRYANLVLLHPACHQWVTEHPADARATGLVVSSYAPDPATVPILLNGSWWLLDDEGGRTPAPNGG